MAEIEKSEEQKTLDGGDTQNHQTPGSENSEKMLKPWMKNLGKEFYMDEELGQYDSLPEAVKALKARPKAKVTPESYGESGEVEEAYKKAGLTSEEAKAISAAYSKRIPKAKPSLEEYFGERLQSVTDSYSKGIGSFADEVTQKAIKDSGLDKDPVFVSIMARVGKETGGDSFNKPDPKPAPKKDAATRAIEAIYGKKE